MLKVGYISNVSNCSCKTATEVHTRAQLNCGYITKDYSQKLNFFFNRVFKKVTT